MSPSHRRLPRVTALLTALAVGGLVASGSPPARAQEGGSQFPPQLVEADRALRAGEPEKALELVRSFQEAGALAEFVPLALFERALASAQLGDLESAACLYSQATYLNDYFTTIDLAPYPEGSTLAGQVRIDQPVEVDGTISQPQPTSRTMPEMTDRLAEQLAASPVVLGTIVTSDGRVVVHSVLETPHGEAALAAIDGVCRWRYQPATDAEGTPLAVWYEVRFDGDEEPAG